MGTDSNRVLIEMQRNEALKAELKEKQRQERLKYGRAMIEATFGGGTVAGLPEKGVRQVDVPRQRGQDRGTSYVEEYTLKPGGPAKTFTGIGQDFYDNYQKSLSDFYKPNVEEQFQEAKSQNIFDLARKGLLRSSVSTDRAGDLVRDKAEADAKVNSEIEGQVTALQGDVRNAKQKAYGLLTSTEDPTTAANTALTEVNAIQTRKPNFDALGELFASALNSYSTFRNAQAGRAAVASIPGNNPSASSGRTYQ